MSLRIRPAFLLACLLTALPAAGASVKPVTDPRPLPPLTANAVPEYPSIAAFLDRSRANGLVPISPLAAERIRAVSAGIAPRIAARGTLAMEVDASLAEPNGTVTRWQRAENGTLRWLEGRLANAFSAQAPASGLSPMAGIVLPPSGMPEKALAALQPYAAMMGLTNLSAELRFRDLQTDARGWQHIRFDQVYQNIPVWGRDLWVHVDPMGEVRIVNGSYDRTPAGVDTVPSRTADTALATVRADFTTRGRWNPVSASVKRLLGYEDSAETLVLYPMPGGPRLAYSVTVRPSLIEWWDVLVDAHTGAILSRIQQHCDATFQDATGIDLNGISRSVRTWKNDQNSSYLFWDLSNYNAAKSALPDTMAGGIITFDLRNKDAGQGNNIYYITSPNNTWTDASSISAHYNADVCFEYYKNTFSRKAIDGLDSTIFSIIHVTSDGQPMDNAFWNGKAMFYGDGDTAFKALAGGLDVAAHEMSHGVIGTSAGLKYQDQSGALNESFADVFGVMVDRDDYLIGEDVMKPGVGIALRDLENPGNPQVLSPQPTKMAEYDYTTSDNGGVHTNSGIPNHAAALIMKAIGREKAEQIYYRALTTYLTSTSQFLDCRNAVEQATKDLYPNGATELNAVKSAWDTVGVKQPAQPPPPPPGGGSAESIPPVTGGTDYLTFAKDDGTIGYMDPGTGDIWTFTSASAKARVTTANNVSDRAQLTTPLDGTSIWFANADGQLAFIQTSDGQVLYFPNLNINQPGDIWNASIAPDGSYVALVSASRNDRSLYVLDLTTGWMGRITLEPETTQENVHDTSILYPDVVSWSPNMGFPKIGFDALHQITVNNLPVQYWGVAEINFGKGRIYDLVPGQPSNITVGNISYSNTDPNVLALNRWEEDGASSNMDVLYYRGGDVTALAMDLILVNGTPMPDPLRPTFSPDDKQIAFTSPSRDILALYTVQTRALTAYFMPFTVYNPRWFVVGGVVPYTFADTVKAVAIASGLSEGTSTDLARLNLATSGTSATRIQMDDAVRISRKVTGLQP